MATTGLYNGIINGNLSILGTKEIDKKILKLIKLYRFLFQLPRDSSFLVSFPAYAVN